MQEIKVSVRNVYGDDKVYPVDDTAVLFTRLTGRKTFTPNDLKVIRDLGYIVTVIGNDAPGWVTGRIS